MQKNWPVVIAAIALWAGIGSPLAQQTAPEPVPVFTVDPDWPTIPNGWTLGLVSKIAVDRHGNIWIIHRPSTVPAGKTAAPPVLEWDAEGKFVRAWGGQGMGYDWPLFEHNIYVDQNDNVYISGSSPNGADPKAPSDDMILKFTPEGKFIKQFGGRSVSKGSTDTKSVNKPGDIYVWPKTNELFIADGYGNRRVLVLDADTFAFKRMWGAFGKPPVDDAESGGPGMLGGPVGQRRPEGGGANPEPNATGPGPATFTAPVHGVLISNDGLLYVSDRANRRVQVFTPQGAYITEFFVNRAGPKSETASGLAFSVDPAQKYLYVADYGNSHILVLDRKSLKVLYEFGQRGPEPGNFRGIHHIAVDPSGNLYTVEVAPGARAQKFIYKGLSKDLPPNALMPEQLPRGALDGG